MGENVRVCRWSLRPRRLPATPAATSPVSLKPTCSSPKFPTWSWSEVVARQPTSEEEDVNAGRCWTEVRRKVRPHSWRSSDIPTTNTRGAFTAQGRSPAGSKAVASSVLGPRASEKLLLPSNTLLHMLVSRPHQQVSKQPPSRKRGREEGGNNPTPATWRCRQVGTWHL